jgi:hypothetical protein
MRRRTSRFVTLASAAALLAGCAEGHPLAPSPTAVGARAAVGLIAPSAAVAVGVSNNGIDLQWKDNSSNETRFEILLSSSGESGPFALRATVGANVVTYSDAGLISRTPYCYSVRAVRTTGGRIEYSPSSNVTCTSTLPVVVPPAAPSNVTAVAVSSEQVDVSWQDNSSDETRFEISMTYSDGGVAYTNTPTTLADVQAFRFESLVPGRQYCYRVRAARIVTVEYGIMYTDYSAYSSTACVVTPFGLPPAASGAVAVPSGSTSVTVAWTGVRRVGISFRIDRSTDGGVAWQVAGTVPSDYGPHSFEDEGLASDRTVCYRIVAYSSTAVGQPSNTTCTTPPAAPTEATVRQLAPTDFELTWRDNSAVEGGYEVRVLYSQCANDGNNQWYCWDYEDTLAVLSANSTSYRLPTGISPGTDGPISVRATKDGGFSDPGTAYVTTP